MTTAEPSTRATALEVLALSHVNVTVSSELEAAAKHFYANVLGLKEIPKPPGPRQNIGAWYDLGNAQLHLSVAEETGNSSDRHVCYSVRDIAMAERQMQKAGVTMIPDSRPIAGVERFYVRDPGGNLIEITEA
ncbi:MAG TPA: VOC family protein [Pyrinomonadaceae bacterium]|nr:VOC family protein [Pyrinomonadaceae bacterium]